jgi:hypothetical protein
MAELVTTTTIDRSKIVRSILIFLGMGCYLEMDFESFV